MNTSKFSEYFNNLSDTLKKIDNHKLIQVVEELMRCRENGNFIYIFGNGGSASNASHIAGDFLKGISYQLEKRFKIVCLNDNLACSTAIANDLSYEDIFVEQLKVFGSEGDLVIGISGSGNSVNIIKALTYAKERGLKTLAVCGYKGGKIIDIADFVIHIPINDMEITEDIHIIVFHAIKQEIIYRLKGNKYTMGDKYDQRVNQ